MNSIIQSILLEQKLYIQNVLRNMPSILELHKLFNSRDVKILSKLVKFINNYYHCKVCIMYMYAYNLLSYLERGGQKIKYCLLLSIACTRTLAHARAQS